MDLYLVRKNAGKVWHWVDYDAPNPWPALCGVKLAPGTRSRWVSSFRPGQLKVICDRCRTENEHTDKMKKEHEDSKHRTKWRSSDGSEHKYRRAT